MDASVIPSRHRIQLVLDGRDPQFGRAALMANQTVIVVALAIFTLSTVPDLPSWLDQALELGNLLVLILFAFEYALRLWAAPSRLGYALSFWGIIDLVSFLPGLVLATSQTQALRALRLLQLVRLLKVARYSKALRRLNRALEEVRGDLVVGLFLAGLVLYVAAAGIWIFEHDAQPDLFGSIFSSLWWAVATLSTVGYGDTYPITVGGRVFTTMVLIVGLAVIAVPTALISAALIRDELEELRDDTW